MIVFIGGISFITNQTQAVPKTLSNKKINATSWAGVNLGEIAKIINGIGNIIKHINKSKYIWSMLNWKLIPKGSTYRADNKQPIKQAGTKSLFLNNRTSTMLNPIPTATIKAIRSPYNPEVVKLPIPMIIIANIAIKITIHVKKLGISLSMKTENKAAKMGADAMRTNVFATAVFWIEYTKQIWVIA